MGEGSRGFWEGCNEGDPRLAKMPEVLAQPRWQELAMPVVAHGDAGAYKSNVTSSILAVSVKSMLTPSFDENVLLSFALPQDVGWHQ